MLGYSCSLRMSGLQGFIRKYFTCVELKSPFSLRLKGCTCRGIFCIAFHRYNELLLHRGVGGKNMLDEGGLIGLKELKSPLRKINGSLGTLFSMFWFYLYHDFSILIWDCCCSKTSASERAMVIGLGGLNLFGVIILGTMLKYDAACFAFVLKNFHYFPYLFIWILTWKEYEW